MLKSVAKQLFAAFLLLSVASPAFSDTATEVNASETATASDATNQGETQTAVVVLTDPEIAAVEDEEPDCE